MVGSAIKFESSVTAASFANESNHGEYLRLISYILAVGLESGEVKVLVLEIKDGNVQVKQDHSLIRSNTHSMAVKSVEWRPRAGELALATCSEDCSVRIFEIKL